MGRPERGAANRDGLAQKWLGRVEVAPGPEQAAEAAQIRGEVRVRLAEGLAARLERLAQQGLGRVGLALHDEEEGKLIQGGRIIGMERAVGLGQQRDPAPRVRDRLAFAPSFRGLSAVLVQGTALSIGAAAATGIEARARRPHPAARPDAAPRLLYSSPGARGQVNQRILMSMGA